MAYHIEFYVPGSEVASWTHAGLLPEKRFEGVAFALPATPARGRARLVFHDRYDNRYESRSEMDEHGYTVAPHEAVTTPPILTWRALWRLREKV